MGSVNFTKLINRENRFVDLIGMIMAIMKADTQVCSPNTGGWGGWEVVCFIHVLLVCFYLFINQFIELLLYA